MPYGITLDYVRLALAHVLTASCERANKLVYSGFSGLPTGLREDDAASEDGLAITVYGANAAAAEARLLAHPDHARALDDEHRRGHRGQGHPDDPRRAAARGDEPARATWPPSSSSARRRRSICASARDLGEGTRRVYALVREHASRPAPGEAPIGDLGELERALAAAGPGPG